jgi:subtilisin family serine protease
MNKNYLRATVGASVFVIPLIASSASHIVLGSPGANLEAAVNAAGGTVTKHLRSIDAVIAEADDSFSERVQQQQGVHSAAPNLKIKWLLDERRSADAVAAAVAPPGNPPGSIDERFNLQWGHTAVRAVDAWNFGYKGRGARVAVVDGGFSLDHPEIAGQFDPACTADMTGEGIAYGPNADDPTGIFAHGMHVAGTIAAKMNGAGTIGIAPEATLCLIKALLNEGFGTFEDIVEGILFAADHNVDVINLSIGGGVRRSGLPGRYTARDAAAMMNFVARAVGYAYQRGALVIVAGGNAAIDGDKDKNLIGLPGGVAHAIQISATTPIGWAINPTTFLDNPASYTNYGRSETALAAPGGDTLYEAIDPIAQCTVAGLARPCFFFDMVHSTGAVVGGTPFYFWGAGTSMSAPHVAGVAALIVSRFGKMHPSQLRRLLERGADDLGQPGNDKYYGAGRVNAIRSLQ